MLSIALGTVMIKLRPYLDILMTGMEIRQKFSIRKIFLAAFTGTFLHVTIDAFHHPSMPTFLPFDARPLFGLFTTFEVRAFSFACLIIGYSIYLMHILDRFELDFAGATS